MPDRFLQRIRRNKEGITRLKTAVVLAVVVVMAVVSAYVALSVVLFSMQKSQEATYASLQEARGMLRLTGGLVAGNVCQLDDADGVWAANNNVTVAKDTTTYVQGEASTNLAIADAFAAGVVGYQAVAGGGNALDLSDCGSVTFWVKSSTSQGDDVLQLVLSENNDGTGTVEKLTIPGSALDGVNWQKVTLSLSGTATNYDAVKSVALVAVADPGTVAIWLDIVEAQPVFSTSNPMNARTEKLVLPIIRTVLTT